MGEDLESIWADEIVSVIMEKVSKWNTFSPEFTMPSRKEVKRKVLAAAKNGDETFSKLAETPRSAERILIDEQIKLLIQQLSRAKLAMWFL
jgi:hypothetical protein